MCKKIPLGINMGGGKGRGVGKVKLLSVFCVPETCSALIKSVTNRIFRAFRFVLSPPHFNLPVGLRYRVGTGVKNLGF